MAVTTSDVAHTAWVVAVILMMAQMRSAATSGPSFGGSSASSIAFLPSAPAGPRIDTTTTTTTTASAATTISNGEPKKVVLEYSDGSLPFFADEIERARPPKQQDVAAVGKAGDDDEMDSGDEASASWRADPRLQRRTKRYRWPATSLTTKLVDHDDTHGYEL